MPKETVHLSNIRHACGAIFSFTSREYPSFAKIVSDLESLGFKKKRDEDYWEHKIANYKKNTGSLGTVKVSLKMSDQQHNVWEVFVYAPKPMNRRNSHLTGIFFAGMLTQTLADTLAVE